MKNIEKNLDKLFSLYVKLRDTNDAGHGHCITCREETTFYGGSCGHYRKRRHRSTRWHEDNAHLQCAKCNLEDKDYTYSAVLCAKFSPKEVVELIQLSNQEVHFSDEELKGKVEELQKKIKELSKTKMFIIK